MSIFDELKEEREYQVSKWGNDLDDQWNNCELVYGTLSYLQDALGNKERATEYWPKKWSEMFGSDSPPTAKNIRSQLIKAATMIMAEIERMDRSVGDGK